MQASGGAGQQAIGAVAVHPVAEDASGGGRHSERRVGLRGIAGKRIVVGHQVAVEAR